MRKSLLIKQSGPYKVESRVDGSLIVTPMWAQYQPFTPEEGGGPGPDVAPISRSPHRGVPERTARRQSPGSSPSRRLHRRKQVTWWHWALLIAFTEALALFDAWAKGKWPFR